jgi:hypothetical protein
MDSNRIIEQTVRSYCPSSPLHGPDGLECYVNWSALDRDSLDDWITDLRAAVTGARRLRKQLEALRESDSRACPACGEPVIGRRGAVYCSATCRVRVHRARQTQTA